MSQMLLGHLIRKNNSRLSIWNSHGSVDPVLLFAKSGHCTEEASLFFKHQFFTLGSKLPTSLPHWTSDRLPLAHTALCSSGGPGSASADKRALSVHSGCRRRQRERAMAAVTKTLCYS